MTFNSQICTTREQSERLLSLGLKKETADMMYEGMAEGELPRIMPYKTEMDYFNLWDSITPAWSLHRLIEMMPPSIKDGYHYSLIYDIHRDAIGYICFANGGLQRPYNRLLWDTQSTDPFDNIIVCIEWLIKEGYFPKEYLV